MPELRGRSSPGPASKDLKIVTAVLRIVASPESRVSPRHASQDVHHSRMEEPNRVCEQALVETAEIDGSEQLVVRWIERDHVFQIERRDIVLPSRALGLRDHEVDGESVPRVQSARSLVVELFADSQKSHRRFELPCRAPVRADWCTD